MSNRIIKVAAGSVLSLGIALSGGALAEGGYDQTGQTRDQNQGQMGQSGAQGGPMGSQQQAQDNMQQMDRDRSGDLSYEEFEQGGMQIQEDYGYEEDQVGDQFSQENFDRYDLNDDDVWDEREYGTWYDDAGDEGFWDV